MHNTACRILPLLLAALILSIGSTASAAGENTDPCPGQGRISTATGQDTGYPVGSKICPGDGSQQIVQGGCEYNPYDVLEREYKGRGSADRCNPTGNISVAPQNNVGGIDAALACRLTKLFEAAKQRGCQVKIISAYRPEAQQQCMCGSGGTGCAAAGASCHQPGRAVDVSAPQCLGWLRMAAPQFQLVFPYYGPHIQCAEHPSASTRSCNRQCNGGTVVNPDLSRLPHPSQVPETYFVPPASSAPPSSGLSNQFRQALGMPQQPTIPSASPTADTSAAANLPQPTQSQFCLPEYKCSGNTLMYKNSFCATQVSQVCSAGCTEDKCNAATSTDTNTNVNDTGTSTIDILSELGGYSATSTSVGTATPLQLLLGLSESQASTSSQTVTRQPIVFAAGSISNTQLIGAQQTFTSNDMSQNISSNTTFQNRSALFAILENMRKVLLWALEYLRPFRASQSHAEQQQASYTIE